MATAAKPIWTPTLEQSEGSRLAAFLERLEVDSLDEAAARARQAPEEFWAVVADHIGVAWSRRFDRAMDTSDGLPWTRFWVGGRLNLAYNAVHRWNERQPDRVALVWEGDDGGTRELTYAELATETARAAAALQALGIAAGDAVGLCLPMLPETVTLFLACAQLGAIVVPLV